MTTRGQESAAGTPPRSAPTVALPPIHESQLPREHALHRPRHGGRQRGALVAAVAFFLVPAMAFVFGVRPLEIENHRLAAFPGLGWSTFTGLGNWATDHLPLRDAGVRAEDGISRALFGEPPAYSRTDRQPAGAPVGPVGEQSPQPATGGTSTDLSQVIEGTNGWLYYAQDMTAKCSPNQPLATTIAALRQLRSAIESSGRSLVLVVAPDKSTAVPRYLPANYPEKQCAQQVENPFWSAVTKDAGAIDLRPGLRSLYSLENRPAYYPLDTHWTDAGAVYLVRAIAEKLSPGVTASWRLTRAATGTTRADLPMMIGGTGVDHFQSYHLSPDGWLDRTQSVIGDLASAQHYTSQATTGMISDSVAVLGDSFLLPAMRYLPAAFSDVTAITYGGMVSDPASVESVLASARTVVLEVVERNLTAGTAPFLEPQVIAGIRADLARHPIR